MNLSSVVTRSVFPEIFLMQIGPIPAATLDGRVNARPHRRQGIDRGLLDSSLISVTFSATLSPNHSPVPVAGLDDICPPHAKDLTN